MRAEHLYQVGWAALAMLFWVNAIAEEPINSDATATPSLELLEFLGEWETEDGAWVDPASLLLDSDTGTPQ